MAVQMLSQSDLGGSPLAQIFNSFDPASQVDELRQRGPGGQAVAAYEYGKALVTGTLEHRDEIDGLIREQAEHWRLERMPVVDRNILRLAVYEFLYETDVPKLVVLDEAIELAKRFGSEQSGRFVNGLLDGLLKRHEFPGRMK
jgi:N utilization substance protein B